MIKQISTALLLLCIGQSFAQRNYYFSSSTGNDSNPGTELSPFQTITKLNNLSPVPAPGSKILFKRGDKFIGQYVVKSSGTLGSPIVYDSYGTGDLPILSASDGSNGIGDPISTIRIYERQYLEFRNLQIENERFDTFPGSVDDQAYGIYYWGDNVLPASGNFEDGQVFKHLRFSNLRFQNIYAVNSVGTEFNEIATSGLHFVRAYLNDVIIEDCYFTDIERLGIWLKGQVSDVIIRNNKFVDIGGSGAIFSNTKRVLYENNLMRFTGSSSDSRMTARGSGMWVFASSDVVAQYNTSQHARGPGDSSGMHVDFGNNNVLFQYNYLEDSSGGFCETLGKNDNIIWRYNVSVNEGNIPGVNKLLWVSDYAGETTKINSTNVYIYNNTIYAGRDYKHAMENTGISLKATSLYFYNNIIHLAAGARLGTITNGYLFDVTTSSFGKNIMNGGTIINNFLNLDNTKIVTDPKLLDPGRRHFSGYKLMATSPAIDAALSFTEPVFPLAGTGIFANITSNATKDIFGNPVNLATVTNIGAYNGPAETILPTINSYEAESANIVGGAEIACVNASGAKAVNVLADAQSLTFDNVNVTATDLYFIKVFYANPVKSNLKVTINSGATETILLPFTNAQCSNSGNPTNFPIIKSLNSGNNSLKFENGIIDKIEIVSVTDALLSTENLGFLNKTDAYLEKTLLSSTENLKLIIDNKIEYDNAEVSIFDISGALLSKKSFTSGDINIETNTFGKGVKIVVARIGNYLFVDKIIIR